MTREQNASVVPFSIGALLGMVLGPTLGLALILIDLS